MKQISHSWAKWPVLLLIVASAVVLLTVTALADAPSVAPADHPTATPTGPTPVPTPPPAAIYISTSHSGHIETEPDDDHDHVVAAASHISFKANDILNCTPTPGGCTWSIFLKGDSIGLKGVNLQDFEVLDNGDIIFSIDRKKTLPDVGKVTPQDVLRYHAGTGFTVELRGSTIGLTKSSESIDAVALTSAGKLVISTIGSAKINGVGNVRDRDLVKIDGTTGALFFDGSSVGLTSSSEDVAAAWVGKQSPDNNVYLVTKGSFSVKSVNTLSGKKSDIFGCNPTAYAGNCAINGCFFYSFFKGKSYGLDKQIDGISVVTTVPIVNAAVSSALQSFAASSVYDDAEDVPFNVEGYTEAMSDNNPDISAEDFIDVQGQVFLPFIATH